MLKEKIQADAVAALKSGNRQGAEILRGLVASIKTKEQEKRYAFSKANPTATEETLLAESTLTDEEVVGALTSEVKKRRDAIALYQEGGRPELAEKEQQEIAIIQQYLPEQIGPEELKKLVQEAISATGAATVKDTGKIMQELMPKVKGRAEGSEISKIIKELLA